ncbi:MAG: NADH-dependent [FeFe] hydrogenase, group A6 [Christensenellales bacterium]|jgi:NADP-reducing hydrogenase subunit HndD
MVNLTINGKSITVPDDYTIMQAAKSIGIHIPGLCHLDNVHKFGSCRICVVEVEGAKTLQASCLVKVSEGMVIHTNSERVRHARRVLYELLLSDHDKDCLSCTRNQTCELQELGKTLGVDETRFDGEHSEYNLESSISITRNMSKCVLCRRCVTVCNQIQGTGVLNAQNRGFQTVIGPAMDLPLGTNNCVFCGQCAVVCPVGALKETDGIKKVWRALSDKSKRCIVQVAPAIRVAIGEEFGYEPGFRVTGKLAQALKTIGFDDIFDTDFAADLTILEEGTEFLSRVKAALTGKGATLPIITSCSPGWIKYIEHMYPDQLDHLSTCKSPHTMLGALAKSFYAEEIGVDPKDMYVVSVMPCTAKKFEINRYEMKNNGYPNVDAVLTTRELGQMIREAGIDFSSLEDREFDNPLGMSTGAADIFGVTGGVMEAALRTVYELVTGRELPFEGLHVTPIVGFEQIKTAEIKIEDPLPDYAFLNGFVVRVAVTSGLSGAKKLMDQVKCGESLYHFIEIMGCPNGCIMGGGQPRSKDPDVREKRLKGIYDEDEGKTIRKSHENPSVKKLYEDFLEYPNSHVSHELLHTHYTKRGRFNEYLDEEYLKNEVELMTEHTRNKGETKKKQAPSVRAARRVHEDLESVRVLALEAELSRLKQELSDSMETVDILKEVMSDYAQKPKRK